MIKERKHKLFTFCKNHTIEYITKSSEEIILHESFDIVTQDNCTACKILDNFSNPNSPNQTKKHRTYADDIKTAKKVGKELYKLGKDVLDSI